MGFHFEVLATDPTGARLGRLTTPHGVIETPAFMPVGTAATVKGQTQHDLEDLDAQIILANTYHLFLRPGHELIRGMGGLHQFMSWPRPILTDSGGFQVFSLSALRKVADEGVTFRSHLDGSEHFLSPEKSLEIEIALGADIAMVLDECIEAPSEESRAREAAGRTLDWARRSRDYFAQPRRRRAANAFRHRAGRHACSAAPRERGCARGSGFSRLRHRRPGRRRIARGHLRDDASRSLASSGGSPALPDGRRQARANSRLRRLGVDMMDCVLPTRSARHGCLFTSQGRLLIRNAQYANDPRPIDESCDCAVCRRYSRAYLRHLYSTGEFLAIILNTHHNLYFYLDIMRQIRKAIRFGKLERFRSDLQARLW